MSKTKRNSEVEALLGQLALILSRNLITNSFPVGAAEEPLSHILNNIKEPEEQRTRNILVVGAGATYNANPNIKLAADAIAIVRSAFATKYGEKIVELIEAKIDELVKVFKLTRLDFETQLLACSIVDKGLVVKQLEELYKLKYPTSLFYEIVAHLFKHRFIDVIINFNFDELLDNAIEEEMSDSQYQYIYSDGHCPDKENMQKDLLYDNRLTFPVYIKPHGTISHPSTLRFTRKAYYETPSKITETIIYLIQGKTGSSIPEREYLPVNLIVTGFGMKSHEFNDILSNYLESNRAKIFYFDTYQEPLVFFERFKKDGINSFNSQNAYLFPIQHPDYGNMTLDDWFYLLWTKIQDSFNETFKPKGIARHVIIHEVFSPMTKYLIDKSYPLFTYFKDRTLMEIAIEILSSSDGLINLRQLKESRVQKYYALYRKEDPKSLDLFAFLEEYGLKKYKGYIKDTWQYDKTNIDFVKSIRGTFKHIVSPKLFENFNNIRDKDRLSEHIDKLANSKKLFLNIRFTARDYHIGVFQRVTNSDIINTDIKWIYVFQQYFFDSKLNRKWNLILSISETGGIFSTPGVLENLNAKKLMLICSYSQTDSDGVLSPKQSKRNKLLATKVSKIKPFLVKNGSEPELRMLPFRNHNQHIVLFVNVEKDTREIRFIGGIYYGRRNMSKRVTPIHVTSRDDLKELFHVYINYWERACNDDKLDLIKQAVVNNTLSPEIVALAQEKSKSREQLTQDIIDIFCKDSEPEE